MKWIFKKQASELDEINKQIEELQKRKQQLEQRQKRKHEKYMEQWVGDEDKLNEIIGKYVIVDSHTGDNYVLGDDSKDIMGDFVPVKYLKNMYTGIYTFNSIEEAKDAMKKHGIKYFLDFYSDKYPDVDPDDKEEVEKIVENEVNNSDLIIEQITENNLYKDNEGYIILKH